MFSHLVSICTVAMGPATLKAGPGTVITIIIPVLYVRQRKFKYLAQRHMASKW